MQPNPLVTVPRFLLEQQDLYKEARGSLTRLLWEITVAAKAVSREVRRAGLIDVLGMTGRENIQGERVAKLDEYAQLRIQTAMEWSGQLCGMASEEVENIITIPEGCPRGNYVLMFDPLDGSSNIDANVSIGTIFSVHKRKSAGPDATLEDFLRKGSEQVVAGYILYGSSTILVYTAGAGVHGFTLDPTMGEFLLSHPNIRIPPKGKIYSINEGNERTWDEGTRAYVRYVKQKDKETGRPYSMRYIGTLVSDFHRNLLYGGIFMYPADVSDPAKPKPKLRLLYEAAPMALLIEQAGGTATTGRERILDVTATNLHQRVPLILGSPEDVRVYEEFYQGKRK